MGGFTEPTDPDYDDDDLFAGPEQDAEERTETPAAPDAEREVASDPDEEYPEQDDPEESYHVGGGADTQGDGLGEGFPGI